MNHMTSAEVRAAFLGFFEEMRHKPVVSSSLVPGNDPTLLFANSGMVQFKDVFTGADKRPYTRATTAQKCMRVSGKHNDLENVGPSPRHHTFFEMLGNFSFGDYFKREACRFAYDLLTKVYGMPADRLFFTVHTSDDEAYNIWAQEIGVPENHIHRLGDKSNFWQMADTGPCGPCSEIFWDWRPEEGDDHALLAREHVEDTGRLVEIWNLVFMQFNQKPDGSREPLPAPSVDTGSGLERVVSVVQNVRNNFETDLFIPIIDKIRALNGASHAQYKADYVPYHVIADHIRAATFLIADGVVPGPKDRGSVCRTILRRAARYGRKIGFEAPFLSEVAEAVIEVMGEHYKEIREKREIIRKAIFQEEIRFGHTLVQGLARLEELLAALPAGGVLSGADSFFLKGSLGLPFEVTRDVAREKGFSVDEKAYQAEEAQHSLVSGGGQAMGVIESTDTYNALLGTLKSTGALGADGVVYDPYSAHVGQLGHNQIVAILRDGQSVTSASVGDRVAVALQATMFYVEAGGQVSDTGSIHGPGSAWIIDVEEVRRPVAGLVLHIGEVVSGSAQVGQNAHPSINAERRLAIMRNHTATHLLHAALRQTLGEHVQQKGSLVAPDRLRFDFSHDSGLSSAELTSIAAQVNQAILANYAVSIAEKDLATARAEGAMALFGEKYGERVRTVRIGNGDASTRAYSYELCGGTHLDSTAGIGSMVITSEGSVAQGVRRVEALTGAGAQAYVANQLETLRALAARLDSAPDKVAARLDAMQEETARIKRENTKLRRSLAHAQFDSMYASAETVNGVVVLAASAEATTPESLREMTEWFAARAQSGVAVLGVVHEGKPQLLVFVTDDLLKRVNAGNLIKTIAPIIGGGGGGRPNMAQAGGKQPEKLAEAIAAGRTLVAEALSK
jgi:alanyl-tRNA synthetase